MEWRISFACYCMMPGPSRIAQSRTLRSLYGMMGKLRRVMIQPMFLKEEIDAAGSLVNDCFGLCRYAYCAGAAATNSAAGRLCGKSGETWPDHLQGSVRIVSR